MKQEEDVFLRTGMMVVALKPVGMTAWLSEVLKMSVKTSESSAAKSLSTRPGILSGPGALRTFILLRYLLMQSVVSVSTWSPGGGGVLCAVVLLCASKQVKKSFSYSAERWSCHRSAERACGQ